MYVFTYENSYTAHTAHTLKINIRFCERAAGIFTEEARMNAVKAVVLAMMAGCNHGCLLNLEAEGGLTRGQLKPRSKASNSTTVYFCKKGFADQVTIPLYTFVECRSTIKSVTYSNDGGSDVILVSFNESSIGAFRTRRQSRWGYYWNVMLNSNQVGDEVLISPGSHLLRVRARTMDRYGVEIDMVTLSLQCEGRAEPDSSTECPTTIAYSCNQNCTY